MQEFKNIIEDIHSGALPAREIPGFFIWLLGKSLWLWVVLVAAVGSVIFIFLR